MTRDTRSRIKIRQDGHANDTQVMPNAMGEGAGMVALNGAPSMWHHDTRGRQSMATALNHFIDEKSRP
jgi:hypothetical protein